MSEYVLDKQYFVDVIKDLIKLAEDRKEYFTKKSAPRCSTRLAVPPDRYTAAFS